MARQHLADAVAVGIQHPDLDAVVEGHADRVEIDRLASVQGVGAERLGLAVELAQRHAHGAKNRNVSGPSAAPPVAAEVSRVKPSRSRSARNSRASAAPERVPLSRAESPILMPPLIEGALER